MTASPCFVIDFLFTSGSLLDRGSDVSATQRAFCAGGLIALFFRFLMLLPFFNLIALPGFCSLDVCGPSSLAFAAELVFFVQSAANSARLMSVKMPFSGRNMYWSTILSAHMFVDDFSVSARTRRGLLNLKTILKKFIIKCIYWQLS